MPIASYDQYCDMLDKAKAGKYAYPAINIVGLESLNAAMEAFAETESDGIIQVSTGGGAHATGSLKDMALGAEVIAEAAHVLAERYNVLIALHTDHCHPKNLAPFMDPLVEASRKRVAAGKKPLYNSHMFDGSELGLKENMEISQKYLKQLAELNMILEVETGVVGGEEDGHDTTGVAIEKLYTTPEDMVDVYEALQPIWAASCSRPPSAMSTASTSRATSSSRPTFSRRSGCGDQQAQGTAPIRWIWSSTAAPAPRRTEIHETLDYGVIKMNVDTDTQYAFTRPIVDHMFKNYDGVLRIEGEMGNKKVYDPRSYLKAAIGNMKARVMEAVHDLSAEGKSLLK